VIHWETERKEVVQETAVKELHYKEFGLDMGLHRPLRFLLGLDWRYAF
jgi:hypothetical protein